MDISKSAASLPAAKLPLIIASSVGLAAAGLCFYKKRTFKESAPFVIGAFVIGLIGGYIFAITIAPTKDSEAK